MSIEKDILRYYFDKVCYGKYICYMHVKIVIGRRIVAKKHA